MKMTLISILLGALGSTPKRLEKELENLEIRGQIETIQATELIRLARILRRVRETCHSNSYEETSAIAGDHKMTTKLDNNLSQNVQDIRKSH